VTKPRLATVIPTFNSERTLSICLASVAHQAEPAEIIIIDDLRTSDRTREIAMEYGARVIVSAAGRAQSRNEGVAATDCEYLLSLDSDMILGRDLISRILGEFGRGMDGLVIQEVGIGQGYWARARGIDKAAVEETGYGVALRAFTREVFDAVGGFDENLLAGEDLDFHERVINRGAKIEHLQSPYIEHDEGRLRLHTAVKKKYWYGLTLPEFEARHGSRMLTRGFGVRLMQGMRLGLREDPLAVPGFIALKCSEALAGLVGRCVAQRNLASIRHIR
jgi:GT2 family glycosyltransferase